MPKLRISMMLWLIVMFMVWCLSYRFFLWSALEDHLQYPGGFAVLIACLLTAGVSVVSWGFIYGDD